jgi:[acyl-carrier-protein] S-malonyltransferase
VILAKTLGAVLNQKWRDILWENSSIGSKRCFIIEDGLKLVSQEHCNAKACEIKPSTMAAVLGLADTIVEEVCASIDGIVVAANYNCPGNL